MVPESDLAPGTLHVVATPIGNLGDFSPRSRQVFSQCDWIASEDTRVTGKLIHTLNLPTKRLISCHEHNETRRADELIRLLASGQRGVLATDAGTPTLGDPGFRLVRACRKQGIPVIPVPGPFAVATALSVSGLPTDRFLFMGFPPPKGAARKTLFEKYRDFPHTLVFFESTHRIHKSVAAATEVFGPDRCAFLAREMTKMHESYLVGNLGDVLEQIQALRLKGELVLVIAPAGYQL